MRKKRKFINLLIFDIKNNISLRKYRILIAFIIILIVYILTLNLGIEIKHENSIINFFFGNDYPIQSGGIIDYEGIKNDNGTIRITNIIIVNILILFIFIDFMYEDFKKREYFLFCRISKIKYYLFKVVSLFINITIIYISLFLMFLLIDFKGSIVEINEVMRCFLFSTLTTFTVIELGVSITIIVNYKIGLLLSLGSILGVIANKSPLIILQHSIIARHMPYSTFDYLSFEKSFIYLLIYIILISFITVGILKLGGNHEGIKCK